MPCKHREGKKNANRVTNVEYASVTPLVFQADDGTAYYYRKPLKHLADACPSKGNKMQHNNNMDKKIKHNNSMDTKEYICFTDAINSMYSWKP